jgi:hypothetical protein
MSTKSIYEEAIADARKIKQVAEENAKKAVLEAVTPRIREFIEQQLLEQKEGYENEAEENEADDHIDEEDENLTLDESAISSLLGLLGDNFDNYDFLSENKSEIDVYALKKAINKLSASERVKLFEVANNISSEKTGHASINNNNAKESNTMSNDKYYEVDLQMLREAVEEDYHTEGTMDGMEEMGTYESEDEAMHYEMSDDDISELYEMLREEEGDEGGEGEMDFGSLFGDAEGGEDDAPEGDAPEGDAPAGDAPAGDLPADIEKAIDDLEAAIMASMGGGAPEGEEAPEDEAPEGDAGEEDEGEEEKLDEVFEIDPRILRQEIAKIRKQLRESKMDHHFGGKGSNAGVAGAFGGKGNYKAGVKGAFGGGKEGQDVFTSPPKTLQMISEMRRVIRQQGLKNRALNEKLKKYVSATNTLREQLEDLNLFNAKLLYVNKLLQNKSLNESQKKSIIKALDKAVNLQEAKTLYKSLTETFTERKGKTLNESRNVGGSSRATTSSSSASKNALAEVSRWTKLAGL